MRRTNRVEPINIGNDGGDIARASVTTTTRMEFVRRVQVLPMVSKCEIYLLRVNEDFLFLTHTN
jgi:hypothetical protein